MWKSSPSDATRLRGKKAPGCVHHAPKFGLEGDWILKTVNSEARTSDFFAHGVEDLSSLIVGYMRFKARILVHRF